METHWKIFTDAKTERKVSRIVHKLFDQLSVEHKDLEIKPYHKGGYTASFSTRVSPDTWSKAVFETISQVQKIGRSWILSDDIQNELDAWSNEPSVTGITSLHVILDS